MLRTRESSLSPWGGGFLRPSIRMVNHCDQYKLYQGARAIAHDAGLQVKLNCPKTLFAPLNRDFKIKVLLLVQNEICITMYNYKIQLKLLLIK